MKILVNSDSSIAMDARLAKYIVGEASELLDRFSDGLTRVEIHVADIDRGKTGKVDKRCLVEVRPRQMKPLVASAQTKDLKTSVNQAMRKMVRALNTTLGKQGLLRTVGKPTPVVVPKAVARARKKALAVRAARATKKAAAEEARLKPRGPQKKKVFRARRTARPQM
jgi:hypothetical protein